MKILTNKYFENFSIKLEDFSDKIEKFKKESEELSFEYLTESSSVFSSNIEGNSLDLNSFKNLKLNKKATKDSDEIDNLISAYDFARKNILNENNFLEVHKLSSKILLIKSKRGIYRDDKVGVFGKNGLVYLAVEPEYIEEKMKELFSDISNLLDKELSIEEVFYYSSFIHLVFVHIHPFSDGNGRCARILEKWFLSEKLGEIFWKLRSEEFYKENKDLYYQNINLGVNYYELDYSKSGDFLNMLTNSV